ncbi:hypothetical protein GCM10009839_74450 [Catenulispora yoronensis]|uniref:Uncharacterized protein n=1 Tax=Catenulispora yoronensis TaxID=450799 RepID=A0ABP5GRF7_9ACTN
MGLARFGRAAMGRFGRAAVARRGPLHPVSAAARAPAESGGAESGGAARAPARDHGQDRPSY